MANTGEQDHLLIDYPAAIYLYTGRKTVPANPAESAVLPRPSKCRDATWPITSWQDSISVVVVEFPEARSFRDLETVRKQCACGT